jgi:hypothetical protein
VATDGFQGFYSETRSYDGAAALWRSLGFEPVFETDHESGQWRHPNGGPYVFLAEQHDRPLDSHPILAVADADAFAAAVPGTTYARPFTPQHWAVTEAIIEDGDGRESSLQAPLPAGVDAPDADAHHAERYG